MNLLVIANRSFYSECSVRAHQLLLGADLYGPPLHGQHGLAQALAERWMRVDSLDDLVGRQFATHGHREFTDQIGGIGTNDMRAEDLAVSADDYFGEPFGFVYANGLAVRSPGEALDSGFGILLFRLRFGQADEGDFGEGVDRVGHDRVIHASRVTQASAMHQVANSVDARQIGLHLLIGAHAPAIIIQALLHQFLQAAGVGAAADRHQDILAGEALLAFLRAGYDASEFAFVCD